MRIQWICVALLIFSVQVAIADDGDTEAEADADETESDVEDVGETAEASEAAEERVQHTNLPAGMETVDPKELGLSERDIAKYFGNVKQLQTLSLPGYGSKAQVLTVGFNDNEKLNLQNFEQLPMAGLEGADKSVAQSAFKQFQSMYGDSNETADLDHLTTLFSQRPKLDVLESLNLIPPGSNQHQSSSQNVHTYEDEEKRVNQQIEQEERNAQNAHAQQQNLYHPQNPYQFAHPNLIPQHPMMFLPPGHPQQMFYPFPTPTPPPQLIPIQFRPLPPPPVLPQVHVEQMLEDAKKEQETMPHVLVQPPVPRRPPPHVIRPMMQQLIRVRSPPPLFAHAQAPTPGPTVQPQLMHIPTAAPQYVHIRQKGEPRPPQQQQQQQQLIQPGQAPLNPGAVRVEHSHYVQYVGPNGQILGTHQFHPQQPTPAPTAAPHELNYAHQSHPLMIIQNPPEMGHTAFLDMYKAHEQQQQQQQQYLKSLDHPPSEEVQSNSLQGAPSPQQFGPELFSQNQQLVNQQFQHQQLVSPQLQFGPQQLLNSQFGQQLMAHQLAHGNYPVPLGPQQFSTIYKQVPILLTRPSLIEQQIQRPFQLQQQQQERHRPIGSHYRGRHIASVRRPFPGPGGPAFGTQPPAFLRGSDYRPVSEPNMFMMAPEPQRPGFGHGQQSPRLPFSLNNINLQAASQQLIQQTVVPFMAGVNKSMNRREPKPSMPLIKITRPENVMRSRKSNKFLEEMVHAFENKLS